MSTYEDDGVEYEECPRCEYSAKPKRGACPKCDLPPEPEPARED